MDFVTLYPSIMHCCGICPESIDHVTISHFLDLKYLCWRMDLRKKNVPVIQDPQNMIML